MERKRAAVGATKPWKEAVVAGVRLAYDDEGTGPALVCLHAIGHGAADFAALRRRFRDRYRVVALDWPGQGSSGDDQVPAGAERYAELFAGFVDQLGLDSLVVLGNSIGGAAAIRFAASAPERVRGLVLVNSGGLTQVDLSVRFFTRAFARFFTAGARGAWWYPRLFDRYYRVVLREEPARAQRERIVAAGSEAAAVLAEAWRSFGRPEADVRALAASLSCPVFVAWAEKDRVIPLSRCRAAIESIPHHRLEKYPAGHAPFLECPDLFLRDLESFLDEVWSQRNESAA